MEFHIGRLVDTASGLLEGARRDCIARAIQAQLEVLQLVVPMDAWMLARAVDDDWIALAAVDDYFGIERGRRFDWKHSFCSLMVAGEAPSTAIDVSQIAVYKAQSDALNMNIGAYLGFPIREPDGSLFGTLCAINRASIAPLTEQQYGVIERVGQTLGGLIQIAAQIDRIEREHDRAEQRANTDVLTGLLNRRGFLRILEGEHARSAHLGTPYSVVIVDLDDLKPINDRFGHAAGDLYLKRAAQALQSVTRAQDAVARAGGDEFIALFPETDSARCRQIEARIRDAMSERDIKASVGGATLRSGESYDDVLARADHRMYQNKQSRKADTST